MANPGGVALCGERDAKGLGVLGFLEKKSDLGSRRSSLFRVLVSSIKPSVVCLKLLDLRCLIL